MQVTSNMSRCKYPQFRVSDSSESFIHFTMEQPGDAELQVAFTDFDILSVWKETELCSSTLKMVLYADSVVAKTTRLTNKLMSPSCLNVKQHRVITFQSKEWERLSDGECLLYGNLSIWGKCKYVVFEVSHIDTRIDADGIVKYCSLQLNGAFKLPDFRLSPDDFPGDFKEEIHIQGKVVFKSEVSSALSLLQNSINSVFELFHSITH